MKKTTKASTPLYTFNWSSGGYNSAYAGSKREALKQVSQKFPGMSVDLTSVKRLSTREAQAAYYKSLPLFD